MWRRIALVAAAVLLLGQSPAVRFPPGTFQNRAALDGSASAACVPGTNATNFLARASGLDAAHIEAYCVLINGLDTDGLFTSFDALYMFATDTTGNAVLSLINATYNATLNNGPTFAANAGYTGNGSNMEISSGYSPLSAGGNYSQNSAQFFCWSNTSAKDGAGICGQLSVDNIYIIPRYTDDNSYGSLQSTAGVGPVASTDGKGMFAVNRNGTAQTLYKNGSSIGSNVDTSIPFVSANTLDGLQNGFGHSSSQVMAMGFGSTLNSTQHGNLYTRVHTYLQTIAGIP